MTDDDEEERRHYLTLRADACRALRILEEGLVAQIDRIGKMTDAEVLSELQAREDVDACWEKLLQRLERDPETRVAAARLRRLSQQTH